MAHKHRWTLQETRVTPTGAIDWVWVCRPCRSTRTAYAKPRKPASTAITDQDRAIRYHRVPVAFVWPEGTPEPEFMLPSILPMT
jgi:hypothetical protein